MSEAELIDRAGGGDPQAIRELHDRYANLVLSVARRITGDADAARDCAQEVWIRALRSLPTFERRSPFSAWLRRIAARVALQSGRSERRRSQREAVFTASDERLVERSEESRRSPARADRLEEAILLLPDGMRRILVLHDVEGFTHEEIGELLEITPGTSKSQLFKARGKVREMIRAAETEQENAGRVTRPSGSWSKGSIERGGVARWSI